MKITLIQLAIVTLLLITGCGSGNNVETSSGIVLHTEEGGGYASSYGTTFFAFDKEKVSLACLDVMTSSYDVTTAKYVIDEATQTIKFNNWSKSPSDIISYPGSSVKYKVADGHITALVLDNGD